MDKRKRNITALGLLTIVAAVVFFWGLYYLLGNPVLKGGMDVVVMLDNGAGLKRGDRVQLQGVEVGSVRSIRLAPTGGVTAELRLNDNIVLPADTRVTVRGDVFGAHTVDIVPGAALVKLEEGDTIRGIATPALPDLAAGLSEQARSVLSAADSLLSPAAVRDVHATAEVLPESARELRAAFAELRLAAAALRRTAEGVETAETGVAVSRAVSEVERTAQALTAAANSMQLSLSTMHEGLGSFASVMAKIDDGQGTLGRLVNDSSLYMEFNQTLREIGALTTDIRERPTRYINLRIF
jgi:phospholipid/cholesterol/gamma-HCH transport system substrate-binding protein